MNRVYKHIFSLAVALVLLAVGTGFFLSRWGSARIVFADDNDDLETELFKDTQLFDQDNMLPGDELVGRWFKVENKSDTTPYDLYFAVRQTEGSTIFADVLSVKIDKETGGTPYDGSLQYLFDLSKDKTSTDDLDENDGVSLDTVLGPSATEKFFISVKFGKNAGNEYKNEKVVFDALLGFVGGVEVEEGVLAATTGKVLGIATGADLIYSVLGSLATLSTGLWLRRRSPSVKQPRIS